ncbi:recombinase family protein [Streptomyces sp. NPDC088360]|uniref:recombinase family protein n=1 Tax=Streptomyces sp. NPDC088360 TaxID=3154515 RepID=UPI00344D2E5F
MELLQKLRKLPGFAVLRAIIYLRISTDREEVYSLTEQLMECTGFTDKYGIEVVAVVEDRGESGGTFEKRKMAAVFEMVTDGKANIVLVGDRSRFGRGGIQLNQAWEKQLNEFGGYLIAVKNPTDITTSAGRTQRDTDDFVAQIQRNTIGDTWQRTHKRRWEEKLPHDGAPRMGYQLCEKCAWHIQTLSNGKTVRRAIKRCGECGGALQPDWVRGDALDEFARRWTDGGESARKLVVEMRDRGVTSVRGNPMGETQWFSALDTGFGWGWRRKRTVPARGRGLTRKYSTNKPDTFDVWEMGKHKPVIVNEDGKPDLALWERYKAKRCQPTDVIASDRKVKHVLSTRLRCGRPKIEELPEERCGMRMGASKTPSGPKGRRVYIDIYTCSGVREKLCKGISVSRHLAHKAVGDWLASQATDEGLGKKAVERNTRQRKRESVVADLEAQIAKLKKKLSRLTDLQLDEEAALHPTAFKMKQGEILAELEPLEARLELQKRNAKLGKAPPTSSAFRRFADAWPAMTDDERRALVESLIHHIDVVKQPGKKNNRLVIVPYWDVVEEQESAPVAHLAASG